MSPWERQSPWFTLDAPMPTIVYIDGFNLYYGALRDALYKWLDLEALCRRLLPKDAINRIRYFTARITARPDDPQQAQRQETYLRALRTLPLVSIHYGHFLTHHVRMPLASPHRGRSRTALVVKTEEKGSDVNLASHLLLNAFKQACDTAVVISNDSDLRVPIRIAEQELGVRVGIIYPHPPAYRSRALRATFFKQLRTGVLDPPSKRPPRTQRQIPRLVLPDSLVSPPTRESP